MQTNTEPGPGIFESISIALFGKSPKRRSRVAITLATVALAAGLLGILGPLAGLVWTGDLRWLWTALIGAAATVALASAWQTANNRDLGK